VVATGVILLQMVLGAVYRHSQEASLVPHVAGACVVTVLVSWVVSTIVMRFARQPDLLHPALLLGGLLIAQLLLGVGSYVMTMAGRNAPQPLPSVVDVTTTHVAVGALLLVTCLYLTYQVHRFLAVRRPELKMASAPHQAGS